MKKQTEYTRRYRAKNREKHNAHQRAYRAANPDKVRAWNAKMGRSAFLKSERKTITKRISAGLCAYCGKRPPDESKRECADCRAYHAKHHSERYYGRAAQGLCVTCGKSTPVPSRVNCETCILKQAALGQLGSVRYWRALLDKLSSQGYRCPYTGTELKIGVNASLDHRLPKSRFPELSKELSNIEWVSIDVNMAKRDRTPEEFLEVVKSIYAYKIRPVL